VNRNANPAVGDGGAQRTDLPGGTIAPRGTPADEFPQAELDQTSRQLEILAVRSLELAERVGAGEIAFLDAVDVAYDGAVWAGLNDIVGDDVVQAVLAEAFRTVRPPR
jgi:hypothetical protein